MIESNITQKNEQTTTEANVDSKKNEQTTTEAKDCPQRFVMSPLQLPPVMRELVSVAPEDFKTATFIACCAPLGCLATRVRFNYPFDQDKHAILLQVIFCAEQSGGKSFARFVENTIMQRQKQRDNKHRRNEQAYRELKQKSPKTEKLPDAPKTTIVCCPVSISVAQLIKRVDAPVRHFGAPLTLWTFTEELATATETSKRAFSNIKSIMRTAYDLGSEYGVDYLSDNSYSATVDIMYNTMFCTTPSALDDYMDRKAIEGGNVTRTILYELDSNLGDEPPIFKTLSETQLLSINATIDKMMNNTYNDDGSIKEEIFLDMSWLNKTARTWCANKNTEAIKSGSKSLGTFFKRCSVSAFRIASLCYYLYQLEGCGSNQSKSRCKKIYLFMADVILRGMMKKWGGKYEEQLTKRQIETTPLRQNLYDTLTKVFTRDQLNECIKKLQLSTTSYVFLSKWNKKGFIKTIGPNTYEKI